MVTKEKLVELKKKLDATEETLRQKDDQLMEEIWTKYRIAELKNQLREAEDKAQKEYDQRKKEEVNKLNQTVQDTKRLLVEKVKEFNKETLQEFMNKLKELVGEGWQIYSVSTSYFYNPSEERKIGDDLWTNFRPESRRISEIIPAKTRFKYKVEYTDCDKVSWGSISTKDAHVIEVELVKKIPPTEGKYRDYYTKEDGTYVHGYAKLACPICYARYGDIRDINGNLVDVKYLPKCKHASRLLKYGEKNEKMTIVWRRASWHKINEDFEPIEVSESS